MPECLFCKIRDGEIPGDIVYENEHVLAFNDINPVAPTHILIIPKEHVSTINDLEILQYLYEDILRFITVKTEEISKEPSVICLLYTSPSPRDRG